MPESLLLDTLHPVRSWVPHPLGPDETRMVANTASLPCVFKHLALMPDAHLGKGAMIGSVIATKDTIIPAAVGVDIGCGMMARKLPLKASALEDKLPRIRSAIEARIPVGFNENREVEQDARKWEGWKAFRKLNLKVQDRKDKAMRQLGTLGGGNHFIEICIDHDHPDPDVWVMLHSGSRGIGNQLASAHIATAKQLAQLAEQQLPDPELAFFVRGTPEFEAYWHDLQWSQEYAFRNREVMMSRILDLLRDLLFDGEPIAPRLSVNCHHNYAALESHFGERIYVTRKGAVRAGSEDYGIIPGSMGAKSFIVKGRGNADSFHSCSHGAGRRMSRNQAKKRFSLRDLKRQTSGVECRKDKGVLDEIPEAYKDIDQVMAAQQDLVEVVACLKQVLCVKG